jgi:hypothetical protein
MALAERVLAHEFNRKGYDIVDHYTFVFAGAWIAIYGGAILTTRAVVRVAFGVNETDQKIRSLLSSRRYRCSLG